MASRGCNGGLNDIVILFVWVVEVGVVVHFWSIAKRDPATRLSVAFGRESLEADKREQNRKLTED